MADDITPQQLEALATEFDNLANSRMKFGQEKYGNFTWLEAPTIPMGNEGFQPNNPRRD
jgi:hypothetical protein